MTKLPLKQYWRLLACYLRPQGNRVYWLAFALLGSIGLQILNPQILRYFIDAAVAQQPAQSLLMMALLFLGVALITQGLMILATYLGEIVAWTATNTLRLDLAHHCLHLDLSFHKHRTPGELIERVDGDVNALSQFFSQFTINILGNGLLLLGILGVLFYEDWRTGLSMTLFALLSLTVLLRLHYFALPYWANLRQISGEFYGFIAEHFAGVEDLRANGATSYVMQRFHAILQRWLPVFYRARLVSTYLWAATIALFSSGQAIALAISAYLWYRGSITIGTVFLIYYYADLLNQPLERIRTQLEELQEAEASIYRIQELLQIQPRLVSNGEQHLPRDEFSVTLEGVWFSYEQSENSLEYALEDISFTLPSGQVLGVLGRTGSGKTTLARLLLRLYDPQKGCIRLGGVPINDVPLSELRHRVGLVTQDVQLFQTTIRNNLTFFDSSIKDEQILEVLHLLGLSSWLLSLPDGLNTFLGADSGGLSAGQAQLLAFARIFLKDPQVIILDEASSRLDPATEFLIERAVSQLLKGRTGIIIAHRLATLQRSDRILILDNGKILEYGTRQALASNPNSRFAQVLNMGVSDVLV